MLCGLPLLMRSRTISALSGLVGDRPGEIWPRVNVRLDRNWSATVCHTRPLVHDAEQLLNPESLPPLFGSTPFRSWQARPA